MKTESTDPNDYCVHCGHTLADHFHDKIIGQTDDRPECRFGDVRAVICKYTNLKDRLWEINTTVSFLKAVGKRLNPLRLSLDHPEMVEIFDKINKLKL